MVHPSLDYPHLDPEGTPRHPQSRRLYLHELDSKVPTAFAFAFSLRQRGSGLGAGLGIRGGDLTGATGEPCANQPVLLLNNLG